MGSNGPPLSEHESLHAVRLETRSETIGLKYTQKHGAVYVVGTEANSAASASELPEGYVARVNGVEVWFSPGTQCNPHTTPPRCRHRRCKR